MQYASTFYYIIHIFASLRCNNLLRKTDQCERGFKNLISLCRTTKDIYLSSQPPVIRQSIVYYDLRNKMSIIHRDRCVHPGSRSILYVQQSLWRCPIVSKRGDSSCDCIDCISATNNTDRFTNRFVDS